MCTLEERCAVSSQYYVAFSLQPTYSQRSEKATPDIALRLSLRRAFTVFADWTGCSNTFYSGTV